MQLELDTNSKIADFMPSLSDDSKNKDGDDDGKESRGRWTQHLRDFPFRSRLTSLPYETRRDVYPPVNLSGLSAFPSTSAPFLFYPALLAPATEKTNRGALRILLARSVGSSASLTSCRGNDLTQYHSIKVLLFKQLANQRKLVSSRLN